jgi:hypothetical protein
MTQKLHQERWLTIRAVSERTGLGERTIPPGHRRGEARRDPTAGPQNGEGSRAGAEPTGERLNGDMCRSGHWFQGCEDVSWYPTSESGGRVDERDAP